MVRTWRGPLAHAASKVDRSTTASHLPGGFCIRFARMIASSLTAALHHQAELLQ